MSNVISIGGKQSDGQPEEDNAIYVLTFLARTVPMRGCDYSGDDEFHSGADLICRLARSYELGSEVPTWSLSQCADVLHYLSNVEPRPMECFCNAQGSGTTNATSGFHLILDLVRDRLRQQEAHP
jgi:hypothetical protein